VTVLLTSGDAASVSVAAEPAGPSPDALRVTFGRVALVPADEDALGIVELDLSGAVDLPTFELPPLPSIDVKEFAVAKGLPGDGVYTQLRLIVDSAAWVFGEGPDELAVPIFVPSGAQSGLKINIEPPLEIDVEGDHVLTVVFDVATAIIETPPGSGNFILKPTAVRVLNETQAVAGSD
jgi:hypothetical protein